MKKLSAFVVLCCLSAIHTFGETSFTINTERTSLAMGEQAVVVASLTTNKNFGGIAPPSVRADDGFSVLNSMRQGPSHYSQIEIVNGVTKQRNEYQYQFVYTITPKKTGSFVFPALELSIDGSTVKTEPIPFTVSNEAVKNQDIKIILSLSKSKLYKGEQSILTFKVAQRNNSPIEIGNGFNAAVNDIEKSFGKDFSLCRLFTDKVSRSQERINGEIYSVFSLRFIVFAINEGTYSIKGVAYPYQELKRTQRRRSNDIFDDFFDSGMFGGGMQAVPKTAVSNSLSIQVKDLPPSPAGFTGAVGNYSIAATLEPKQVKAGEATTLKITLKGNTRAGNLGEIAIPKFDGFEVFTPEKQTVSDTSDNGISSRKTLKYMLIPQEPGNFTLPSLSYTYFDPSQGAYKTATTGELTLNVTEGNANVKQPTRYMSQQEIQQVGQDIRFIKTDKQIKNQTEYPYKEPLFYLLIPIPFILFILSLIFKFQMTKRQNNVSLYTRQKALANASKQIASIKKQGSSLSQSQFLGKIASVLETYISDKFAFTATGRTLEELKEELLKQNADVTVVNDLALFIEHLDGYRFGGVKFDESSRMSTLDKSVKFLENLEKGIKKEKSSMAKTVALLITLLAGIFISESSSAPIDLWFTQANKFYESQNFDSAAVYYQKIINAGVTNSAVYFNQGNSHFRLKKLGLARLYYEKAANLKPADEDINANIRFVKASIIDKVSEPEKDFLETFFWKLHILFSLKTQLWIILSTLMVISIFLSLALYTGRNTRLWLIYLSVLLTLGLSAIGISAGLKIFDAENSSYAIVLDPSVDVKNEPDGKKIFFTVHEGTKFRIRQEEEKWSLVSLPNGEFGWVKNSSIGKI
jgi:tetratricopeptide (TPR) repeat protein